jgi:DNA-binding transcriptional ArsR family regulator
MKPADAVNALSALAHEHRLQVFRLLVERGPEGLAAGDIAERLGVPPSSLTFHTQALLRAGLVRQERQSRQLIYTASFDAMNDLVGFLTENCCAGASSEACKAVCAPKALAAPKKRRA